MQKIGDSDLQRHFLAWQCRIRQLALRQHGGQPTPGMMPQVCLASGDVVMPSMTALLVPREPEEITGFFEFQTKKSNDPRQVYEAGLKFLQADYYQKPKRFSDRLVAQFAASSKVADTLLAAGECLLTFDQYAQVWLLACEVSKLPPGDAVGSHTLAHNRIFNPRVPDDATVLLFTPIWAKAQARPMPPGSE